MVQHARAGQRCEAHDLVDLDRLIQAYHAPAGNPSAAPVHFGTSGHRGSSLRGSFQDIHVAALTQAIVELRGSWGATGALFIGADSHALSAEALQTLREVLADTDVDARFSIADAMVPTPVISNAIIQWNRANPDNLADGIILTPSHNPPQDGGFKYNPPSGGPAEPEVTDQIAARANELLANPDQIRRRALGNASGGQPEDMVGNYVDNLATVIDLDVIRSANLRIAVDPLGGSALPVWQEIQKRHGIQIEILNEEIDPRFAFMHLDHDGIIRMDCSSPFAMRGVVERTNGFDVGIGHDPDADRHGIVTKRGVMNPNQFLSLAVDHLLRTRTGWNADAKIGRTVVTSAMIDRVAQHHGREVFETPVGFKWFVEGMNAGDLVFGGEESAGASFVDFEGKPWSTDKDGIIMGLLAAEIIATRGTDLDTLWDALVETHGEVFYARRDQAASDQVRALIKATQPEDITVDSLGGSAITRASTTARGNHASIGGIRLETADGWVAMRPSGTEDILKVYAESFRSQEHVDALLHDVESLVRALVSSKRPADHSASTKRA